MNDPHDVSPMRMHRFAVPAPIRRMLILAAAAVLIAVRQPDVFVRPQLFAEDSTWLENAYNYGALSAVPVPDTGYIQLLSRLVGGIASHLPLEWAPYVFVYASLGVRLLYVAVLLSSRNTLLPGWQKYAVAFAGIMLPNSEEFHMHFNYSQWYLALASLLLLLYPASRTPSERIRDSVIVSVSSLSGPFVFLFVPILAYLFFIRRKRDILPYLPVTVVSAALQTFLLVSGHRAIPGIPPTALYDGVTILARHVILGSVLTQHSVLAVYDWSGQSVWPSLAAAAAGSVVFGTAFLRAGAELRLFLLFGAGILIMSVVNSTAGRYWSILSDAFGIRYWSIPGITLWASIVTVAGRKGIGIARICAYLFVAVFAGTLMLDGGRLIYPEQPDRHWDRELQEFYRLPKGFTAVIPVNPEGWEATLVRK